MTTNTKYRKDGTAHPSKLFLKGLRRRRVVVFAHVVVLAEQSQPLHVLRLHDRLLHAQRVLDDSDRAPDVEAVILEEPGPLQLLHADESRTAPGSLTGEGARDAVRRRRPPHQRDTLVIMHQSESTQRGRRSRAPGGGVTPPEVQRDEAGVILPLVVEIATESPDVASCLEGLNAEDSMLLSFLP